MGLELVDKPRKTPNLLIDLDLNCILCGESGATQNRFCLECINFGTQVEIPNPGEFFDEKTGKELDFLLSAEIANIAQNLIESYTEDFDRLNMVEIDYFWKRKGGETSGRRVLGKCVKVTGPLKYYSKKDFIIWIAADHCFRFNLYQLTAVTFHELLHAHYTNDAELRGHDLEVFGREIEVFGDWKGDIAAIRNSYKKSEKMNSEQLKLFT